MVIGSLPLIIAWKTHLCELSILVDAPSEFSSTNSLFVLPQPINLFAFYSCCYSKLCNTSVIYQTIFLHHKMLLFPLYFMDSFQSEMHNDPSISNKPSCNPYKDSQLWPCHSQKAKLFSILISSCSVVFFFGGGNLICSKPCICMWMHIEIYLACLTDSWVQVNQAILGIHGVDVQFSGINFLESLVHVSLLLHHLSDNILLYFLICTRK